MKLVIDEKMKHRLVGLSVLLSLAAIFFPAMIKKSSQRLESNFNVHVKFPPKPTAPKVEVTGEKELFKTIKVAQLKEPLVVAPKISELSKEDFIPSVRVAANHASSERKALVLPNEADESITLALNTAAKNVIKKQGALTAQKSNAQSTSNSRVRNTQKVSIVPKKANELKRKEVLYAIQLASFSKLSNAQSLVDALHKKGHKANYVKINTRKGAIYKVYAGHSPRKNEVLKLKSQLASAMQLKGFVVEAGGNNVISVG